jgi:hypothetical protein
MIGLIEDDNIKNISSPQETGGDVFPTKRRKYVGLHRNIVFMPG